MLLFTIATLCLLTGANSNTIRIPLKKMRVSKNTTQRYGSDINRQLLKYDKSNLENLLMDDAIYVGAISLGTPNQEFVVFFDSFSPILGIVSTNSHFNDFSSVYDPKKSKTYIANGKKVTFESSFGFLKGFFSIDTLQVAGLNLKTQEFAELSHQDAVPALWPYSGLFGLGIHKTKANPVYNMYLQKLIKRPIFSVYINRTVNYDSSVQPAGEILFGGINRKHYYGKINYVPLISPHNWLLKFDYLNLGNVTFGERTVLMNPLTSLILVPLFEYMALMNSINPSHDLTPWFNCSDIPKLPKIEFVVKDVRLVLTGEDYTYQIPSSPVCYFYFEAQPDDTLYWIVGTAFMAKHYTVFDMKHNRVGFALNSV